MLPIYVASSRLLFVADRRIPAIPAGEWPRRLLELQADEEDGYAAAGAERREWRG